MVGGAGPGIALVSLERTEDVWFLAKERFWLHIPLLIHIPPLIPFFIDNSYFHLISK